MTDLGPYIMQVNGPNRLCVCTMMKTTLSVAISHSLRLRGCTCGGPKFRATRSRKYLGSLSWLCDVMNSVVFYRVSESKGSKITHNFKSWLKHTTQSTWRGFGPKGCAMLIRLSPNLGKQMVVTISVVACIVGDAHPYTHTYDVHVTISLSPIQPIQNPTFHHLKIIEAQSSVLTGKISKDTPSH
eukprot:3374769-Amphidinium_carterae.1